MLLDLPNRFTNPVAEPEIPHPTIEGRNWKFVADPLLDCIHYLNLIRARRADEDPKARVDRATEFLTGAIHPHDKVEFDEALDDPSTGMGGQWRIQAASALLIHYIRGGEPPPAPRNGDSAETPDEDDGILDLTEEGGGSVPLS